MERSRLTLDDSSSAEGAGETDTTISDEVILESSQERPALFSILVDRYQGPFFRLAQRVVHDRGDAEDVVQEAFIKIYRYAKGFRKGEDRKFSSWAYKIVMNTAITRYHKIRKRDWLIPEDTDPTAGEARVRFKEAMIEGETKEIVRAVLEEMPQDLRVLLAAYYLEDKPYQVIAAEQGITIGALKMKLFRARKLFRRFLV